MFPCLVVRLSRHGDTRPNLTSTCPGHPKPIHFLKAYDNSYSKMNWEHKYKDKDEYKDNDKDKDAERITESLTVCYIFGILMTQAFQVWWWIPPPGQPHHPRHPTKSVFSFSKYFPSTFFFKRICLKYIKIHNRFKSSHKKHCHQNILFWQKQPNQNVIHVKCYILGLIQQRSRKGQQSTFI